MFLILQTCNKIYMISLQDSGESGDKVQNDVTTTKQIVTYTILYNITIKKTPFWLLNVILESRRNGTMIHG